MSGDAIRANERDDILTVVPERRQGERREADRAEHYAGQALIAAALAWEVARATGGWSTYDEAGDALTDTIKIYQAVTE